VEAVIRIDAEDGTTVLQDGPWTLIDPRTTFGDKYREFDGWWREPTDDEERAAHPE
jgi:hypothetical protein